MKTNRITKTELTIIFKGNPVTRETHIVFQSNGIIAGIIGTLRFRWNPLKSNMPFLIWPKGFKPTQKQINWSQHAVKLFVAAYRDAKLA